MIDLAKAICPAYDATNEFWITVISLSDDLLVAKHELLRLVNERNIELKKDTKSSDLAKSVLQGLSSKTKDPPPNIIQISVKSDITTPLLDQSVANSTNNGDQSDNLYSVNLSKDINDEVNNKEDDTSTGHSSVS